MKRPEKKTSFETRKPTSWKVGLSHFGSLGKPCLMGILNVTPDSFFDGGQFNSKTGAYDQAMRMIEAGAEIIDVGGESSRPGAAVVSEQEELDRVLPIVERLSAESVVVSIDTVKARVAQEALRCGALIVNDISALQKDPKMKSVVLENPCSVVLNHMQGTPQTMQDNPSYTSVVREVVKELREVAEGLVLGGMEKERICLDPGIGFGKTLEHNYQLLWEIAQLVDSSYPILIGTSRKSFIGKTKGLEDSDRLLPSIATVLMTRLGGAGIFRVHDVKETWEALQIIRQMEALCLKD